MKKTNKFLTIAMFVFLYAPMAVLIVASFNTGKDITDFEGFTFQQYVRLFQDRSLLSLLGNSLLVSILASLIATVFGTVAAVGIHNLSPKLRKTVLKKQKRRCWDCMHKSPARITYGPNVHHLNPVRERPDLALSEYDEAGRINLVCLCDSCHWERHHQRRAFINEERW